MDSFNIVQTGRLVAASDMEVHDCCTKTQVASSTIFQCIHDIGGLCSLTSYPKSEGACKNDTCTSVIMVIDNLIRNLIEKSHALYDNSFGENNI